MGKVKLIRSMPKVLRIINRFNLGGPTYNAVHLTDLLAKGKPGETRFETLLIGGVPAPGEAHSGYIAQKAGIQFREIATMSRKINLLNDLKTFFHMIRLIREFRPDVVHTHAAKAGALGRLAAWLCRVPVIVHTYHGNVFQGYFGEFKSRLVRLIERLLCSITTHVVCISEQQFAEITQTFNIVNPKKASIISLGFDLDRFLHLKLDKREQFRNKYNIGKGEIALGIIGRLAPVKNHSLFLDAFSLAKKEHPNLRALIIGDGELKETLKTRCTELGLTFDDGANCDVIFTSWILEIEDALAGLDIVVLTSINEGTPVSLIEAQAASLPVISTDVGGVRDCMLPGKSGFITTQYANDICQSISTLAGSDAQRQQMGETGKQFVLERYSKQRLADDMRKLYLQLLNKG